MECHNEIEILSGEKRWLEFEVVSCREHNDYKILAADYESCPCYGQGATEIGNCLIDNEAKTIKMLFTPSAPGVYIITFTWSIADEIFKEKVRVNVC